MDAAVVGDAAPVPFVEREAFASMSRGDLSARVAAAVAVVADIHERSAGVWRAIMEAAVGDPEVDAWRLELERGRRIDTERSVAVIIGDELDAMTVDLVWVLLGPEVYLKLTGDAGHSRAEYERYVRHVIERIGLSVPRRRRGSRSTRP